MAQAVAETPVEAAATWGSRLAAWLIDIVVAFATPIAVVGVAASVAGADDETTVALSYLLAFPLLLLLPLYFAVCQGGERGQTLGKRSLGIAVRDARTGGRLGYGRAIARAYLMLVFYVFGFVAALVVDCLWPLWDKRNQALHDKAVRSIVVRWPADAGPGST